MKHTLHAVILGILSMAFVNCGAHNSDSFSSESAEAAYADDATLTEQDKLPTELKTQSEDESQEPLAAEGKTDKAKVITVSDFEKFQKLFEEREKKIELCFKAAEAKFPKISEGLRVCSRQTSELYTHLVKDKLGLDEQGARELRGCLAGVKVNSPETDKPNKILCEEFRIALEEVHKTHQACLAKLGDGLKKRNDYLTQCLPAIIRYRPAPQNFEQ